MARALSCSEACGIFPDQGLNQCALNWKADSQPLDHQGSPEIIFMVTIVACLPAESPSMLIIEPFPTTSPGLILFTRMCSMPCGSDGMFRRFKMCGPNWCYGLSSPSTPCRNSRSSPGLPPTPNDDPSLLDHIPTSRGLLHQRFP